MVCRLSALEIRGFGVQAPSRSVSHCRTHAPKGTEVAVLITRRSGAAFREGIESVVLDGALVRA